MTPLIDDIIKSDNIDLKKVYESTEHVEQVVPEEKKELKPPPFI